MLLCTFTLSAQLKGDSWKSSLEKKSGKLTVVHFELPRYAATNKQSGKLEGICPEILDDFIAYVKRTKGVTVTPVFVGSGTNYKSTYESVKSGQSGVLGIGNVSITEQRKKEVQFTRPYLKSRTLLITASEVPTLVSLDDIPNVFSDFKAYTVAKTRIDMDVNAIKKKYLPNLVIQNTDSYATLTSKVAADPKSFTFIGINQLFEYRDKSIKNHRVGNGDPVGLGFIMPLNSDWGPIFDEFMAADGGYTNSARFKEILVKHLSLSGYRLLKSLD